MTFFHYICGMNSIVDHIEYLLREHDCVILPGWGAFIAQRTSALREEHRFVPPMRRYGFNGALTFSDGMLENSIMRQNKCSYSAATDEIKSAVMAFRRQVEVSGELAIGRIGLFSKNEDGGLQFSPFEQQSSASGLFGLQPFRMKSLSEISAERMETAETAEANEPLDSAEADNVRWLPRINKEFMRIAASVIVLFILTFVLTTPLSVNTTPDYAGLNDSFKIKSSDCVSLHNERQKESGQDSAFAVKPERHEDTSDTAPTGVIGESAASRFNDGRFCLIVASGSSMREAEKFVSYHKGIELRIYKADSRYRVYAATDDSYETLLDIQKEIRQEFAESWICRR